MKGSFDHALTCQTRAPDISGFHFIFLDDILINLNGRLYYNFFYLGVREYVEAVKFLYKPFYWIICLENRISCFLNIMGPETI
jgi:hypothetical protein